MIAVPETEQNPAYRPAPMNMQENWAIIVAAGSGSRMASATGGLPKQFLLWRGMPLYWHSVLAFARSACVRGAALVFPPEYCESEMRRVGELRAQNDPGILCKIVAGGASRQESARNGLASLPLSCQNVFVHDAARPFASPALINRVAAALSGDIAGVIPALPLTDTIKVVSGGIVQKTLARDSLMAVQTPQLFAAPLLREAQRQDAQVTDDASLLEMAGHKVAVVPGEAGNIKITGPEDLGLLAEEKGVFCSAFGYDVHRFGPGRPLRLGGVVIPGQWQVIAHSDGDVLLHALMDAILGCACLGDIGDHFPDNDPALDNISSAILLDETLAMARKAGIEICGADLTVIAQKPRLSPWKREIRKNVARLLGLADNCVNVKATTEEGLGFTGAMEGIKACALVNARRLA